ncbi:hypothetical protein G6O67_007499 [Ophiocordyceps sinensis]|uniref:Protein kinase-like domain protein n=2 Tax=Ophiocordyceps sinensis TaxID=72228 RepID=A0A8H4LUF8_9HYPO|nr:Protein kinase-like domain protein [Ophiocordyceps sinensis CO18]KAF4505565.1 hypothetical protein G6O67_007499 [Ophiocordyceps sinensis]
MDLDYLDYPVAQCQFQLQSHGSSISAVGRAVGVTHPHVLRLVVQRHLFARCMHWLISRLPPSPRVRAALPPAWWLPSNIVVKQLKPDWDDEFANELAMYAKLKPLQGSVIPVCYGEARCQDGSRAIVLSDVGGFSFWADEVVAMQEERLTQMTKEAFSALISYGVLYDDLKLDNVHVVGSKVVILDLESARPRKQGTSEFEALDIMELWKDLRQDREDNKNWKGWAH